MTVELYGPREIAALRRAGEAAAATLAFIGDRLRPGVTTAEIDAWVREHTTRLQRFSVAWNATGLRPCPSGKRSAVALS
jgi:methionine aminopeptidase